MWWKSSPATLLRAVLDVVPLARPFLAPFERQATALTHLRWVAVLVVRSASHVLKIGQVADSYSI